MKYFYLEPEVAGSVGPNTTMDSRFFPPIVSRLHYEFDTWLGDVLLESFPCWIATSQAAQKIMTSGFTGVSLGEVEVTTSELFRDLYPSRKLPKFTWLKIEGTPGRDDFGVAKGSKITDSAKSFDRLTFSLVVSERALFLLRGLGIAHALIYKFRR